MKVLIINTNRNHQPFSVMPVGACIVADAAREAGHSVRMLDLMFQDQPTHALELELQRQIPDVVGLSIRNIDNNDMRNPVVYFKELPGLIEAVRKRASAPVVLGGPAVGLMPEELLRCTGADWAVLGNGETVFPRLLESLAQNRRPTKLPGLGWIENGIFYQTPPDLSEIPDRCLVPDFSRWLMMKKYLSRLSTIPVQTKRGCPYECIYCTYAISEGRDYRLYDPVSVARGIQGLIDQGFLDIEFVDNVFNSPYDHAMGICRELSTLRRKPRLQSLELNPLYVDDPLLSAMEKAGFVAVGVTAESVSDPVLTGLKKGYKAQHIYRAAECIQRHGIPCAWIFMFGGPGETPATVQETLDFAHQYVRPTDVAFFNIGLRIYPGTELERLARAEGVLTVPACEMLNPIFYLSPHLDRQWFIEKMETVMATHMNFLDSGSLSLPLIPWIYRIGHRLGMRHPIWKYTRIIRKTLRSFGMEV